MLLNVGKSGTGAGEMAGKLSLIALWSLSVALTRKRSFVHFPFLQDDVGLRCWPMKNMALRVMADDWQVRLERNGT